MLTLLYFHLAFQVVNILFSFLFNNNKIFIIIIVIIIIFVFRDE